MSNLTGGEDLTEAKQVDGKLVLMSRLKKPLFTKEVQMHLLFYYSKKETSSEENRNKIEDALIKRNTAARISKISRVSKGGLVIEAPTDADLQALEAELSCIDNIAESFVLSRPRKRRTQIILLGVDKEVDKDRLLKGLASKNHHYVTLKIDPSLKFVFPLKLVEAPTVFCLYVQESTEGCLTSRDSTLSGQDMNLTTSSVQNSAVIANDLVILRRDVRD
ncbi:hypothetical protein AVEN_66518-1 [Araneus ventricosus]|uniref:Uncharacterized protein n=1 Tax=Araneus ventricosus TaxID=182803 RepID=A0A4Y2EDC7_ARAVE|nr:hypothetical protein AVEN_66518-1 [Araneus ventricosus]